MSNKCCDLNVVSSEDLDKLISDGSGNNLDNSGNFNSVKNFNSIEEAKIGLENILQKHNKKLETL